MQHKFKTGEADLHILYNGLAVTDEDEMQTLDIDGETCMLCVCCDRGIDLQRDKRTDTVLVTQAAICCCGNTPLRENAGLCCCCC